MTINMEKMQEVAQSSRDQIQKLINRDVLSTPLDDPGQGRSRNFTRENALELAFATAFTRAGASVSDAIAYTQMIVRNDKRKVVKPWMAFPAGGVKSALGFDQVPNAEELLAKFDCDLVVLVHAKGILDRIDKAFARAEEERLAKANR